MQGGGRGGTADNLRVGLWGKILPSSSSSHQYTGQRERQRDLRGVYSDSEESLGRTSATMELPLVLLVLTGSCLVKGLGKFLLLQGMLPGAAFPL